MNYRNLEGEKIHGFLFTSSRPIKEYEGTLHLAVYEKNGAELAFLERDDSNKTFAIAFKTIPTDDTGIFHILEHSVLCGSRKFPVKEPFVELLKSSLKTFLNAITFPDKTVYPISSRNEKDFLNLTDVYMDAVFYPRAIYDKNVFLQEGWHFETEGADKPLTYNGVVFNEMKGAYSSADEVELSRMSKLLYEGSCYSKDSGGDPKMIPTLTFEDFVAAHKKYYHPSNSRIFLDGRVNLEDTLALLDSYLCDYDRAVIDTDTGKAKNPCGKVEQIEYEIAESEDPTSMHRICLGYKLGRFDEVKKLTAFNVITDCIAGTNESAFKKAMLDSGLCEDVCFFGFDGMEENCILLEIRNVKEEDIDSAIALAKNTLRDIVSGGIDKQALTASFNMFEFKAREQDTGSYPKGIATAIASLSTWLYGDDPMKGLEYEELLSALRKDIETDYYERLIEEVILNSSHTATLVMHPSKTLGEVRESGERARLEEIRASLTPSDIESIIEEAEGLHEAQSAPDKKEDLEKLPRISISDIEKTPEPIPYAVSEVDGCKVIFTKAPTSGITYMNLLFNISDLDEKELFCASVMTELLCAVGTDSYSASELQNRIKSNLGALSVTTTVIKTTEGVTPYVKVSASFLDSKAEVAIDTIRQILKHSHVSDKDKLKKILKQIKTATFEGICSSGHTAAFNRAAAYSFSNCAITEYTDGIEFYKLIKELDRDFENEYPSFAKRLCEIYEKAFSRDRLTLSYSGAEDNEKANLAISSLPKTGEKICPKEIKPLGKLNEGIIIPSGVSYVAMVGNMFDNPADSGEPLHGSVSVAKTMLSYGYLWNTVRVMGGAYGAGFIARRGGALGFYSYRDPGAASTLAAYENAAEALRRAAEEEDDLTSYIIGAVGETDVLITPKNIGTLGMVLALSGDGEKIRAKSRAQMLSTSKEDLLRVADMIDRAVSDDCFCMIGGKEKIQTLGDRAKNIYEI